MTCEDNGKCIPIDLDGTTTSSCLVVMERFDCDNESTNFPAIALPDSLEMLKGNGDGYLSTEECAGLWTFLGILSCQLFDVLSSRSYDSELLSETTVDTDARDYISSFTLPDSLKYTNNNHKGKTYKYRGLMSPTTINK